MVTSSPTKKIKVELRSAIRDGFAERGWRRVRGNSSEFQAPESQVALPLALRVSVAIDSHSYGGATLTADAGIQCDEVADVLVGFDRASMPRDFSYFPGDEVVRSSLDLGVQTAGGLLDPLGNYYRWVVEELAGVPAAAGEFFAPR